MRRQGCICLDRTEGKAKDQEGTRSCACVLVLWSCELLSICGRAEEESKGEEQNKPRETSFRRRSARSRLNNKKQIQIFPPGKN